jgi:hypothetical protein
MLFMRMHRLFKNVRYGNGITRNIVYNDASNDSRGFYFCSITKSRRGRVLTPQDSIFLLFFIATILIGAGMWYGDKTDASSKRNK